MLPHNQKKQTNMLFDTSRALVHHLTDGKEGLSPYVIADVISCLAQRMCGVCVVRVCFRPVKIILRVEGRLVAIYGASTQEQMTNPNSMMFYAIATPHEAVRFDALECLNNAPSEVLQNERVKSAMQHIHKDWSRNWRSAMSVVEKGNDRMYYLSHHRFVDAIQCLLGVIDKK